MLTNATDKSPKTLTQIEFTKDHVKHPDQYDPSNKENQERDRKLINFTIVDGKPICSITHEPLEVGKIIAVCNKCLSPFSKIDLWKYFVHAEKNKCPMQCDAFLNVEELKFSELERILVEKVILQDEIAILQESLTSSENNLKRAINANKTSTKLKEALQKGNEENSKTKNLSSRPITTSHDLNNSFLEAKEKEIQKSQKEIEERQTTLIKLSNEEAEICGKKESPDFNKGKSSKNSTNDPKSWQNAMEYQIETARAEIASLRRNLTNLTKEERAILSQGKSDERLKYYNELLKEAFIVASISISIILVYSMFHKRVCDFPN